MKKRIKNLRIEGRRWFAKSAGNTYHSVIVYVNNETLQCNFAYGYGDQFLQTAAKLLVDAGYDLILKDSQFFGSYHLCEKLNGCYFVSDVARKKDL
jgi:hypothetical protein